jgi:asparagine synthase (glutamine-hydrolysing)
MCGIAGFWTRGAGVKPLKLDVRSMLATLRHRGPDDEGCWADQGCGVALGHTRLAIIDLSTRARQPMVGPSGDTRIAFNGEVYNYVESRKNLEREGVRFRNDSDTLVILALYERYGLDCLDRLRGMFAFGLWDAANRRLVLARDRVGKKPLYYCRHGNTLYFASEMKAILAVLPERPTIDPAALDEYLSYGFISGERTIYRQLRELPPGSTLVASNPDEILVSRYWQPRWSPKHVGPVADLVDEADDLLSEAVRLRLRADVPVGVFLSGGIDSGLVTAMAAKTGGSQVRTFSVGFEQEGLFDERQLARQTAQKYQTEHHEVVLRPDVAALIPRIAWHYDEPFADPSAIPSFAIAEFASRHVKVVLNGDGGDELFAGYRRHLAAAVRGRLSLWIPDGVLRPLAGGCLRLLPRPRSFRSRYSLLHRLLRGLAANSEDRLLIWHADGFSPTEKRSLFSGAIQPFGGPLPVQELARSLSSLGEVDRTLALDQLWYLPGDLLVKMDVATMAYGLEARSPLLDQELVGWANRLRETDRLTGFTTKPILRQLAKRYLPGDVVRAPKRGFELPLYDWLRNELREMRDDLILARGGLLSSIVDRPFLERLLREPPQSPRRWVSQTWSLFALAAWDCYRYRNEPVVAVSA